MRKYNLHKEAAVNQFRSFLNQKFKEAEEQCSYLDAIKTLKVMKQELSKSIKNYGL